MILKIKIEILKIFLLELDFSSQNKEEPNGQESSHSDVGDDATIDSGDKPTS